MTDFAQLLGHASNKSDVFVCLLLLAESLVEISHQTKREVGTTRRSSDGARVGSCYRLSR